MKDRSKCRNNRCFCGVCPKCIKSNSYGRKDTGCSCRQPNCDCARWERIWKERIEDRSYYARPSVPVILQSTLRSTT